MRGHTGQQQGMGGLGGARRASRECCSCHSLQAALRCPWPLTGIQGPVTSRLTLRPPSQAQSHLLEEWASVRQGLGGRQAGWHHNTRKGCHRPKVTLGHQMRTIQMGASKVPRKKGPACRRDCWVQMAGFQESPYGSKHTHVHTHTNTQTYTLLPS